jgi:phosphatidylinositol alpha-mannosyltransferase
VSEALVAALPPLLPRPQTLPRLSVALVYDDSLDRFGGIPQYLGVLGEALTRAGHEVTLLVGDTVATDIGGCPVYSLARNVKVRFNGNVLSMPVIADRAAIRSVVREHGFDVVHVQVPYSPVMAGRLIRQLPAEVAVVGTFHIASERLVPRLGARLLSAWTTAARLRFDEMICVSGHAAEFARTTFGVSEPTIVPNMVDVSAFWRAPPSPPDVPTVVSLGALVPRKGYVELVDAFAMVARNLPHAQLVIAGDGPLRNRLQRRIRRLQLSSRVRLVGPVAEREKAELLRNAHVACFPSRYGESFGIVLLEAMATNGPAVIGGRNGGYAEVLAATPTALFEPAPAPIARALMSLLQDNERRWRLAASQHELVWRYDARTVANEVAQVYRTAIASRRRLAAHDVGA